VAAALGAAAGQLLFRPAPLRVYLWTTSPTLGPSRVLSEPVVLSETEAQEVSRALGQGATAYVFDGRSWSLAPVPPARANQPL
jgi:hypothetical protein